MKIQHNSSKIKNKAFSLALFLVLVAFSYSALFGFGLSFSFIITPLCWFLTKDRKGIDVDGKGVGE